MYFRGVLIALISLGSITGCSGENSPGDHSSKSLATRTEEIAAWHFVGGKKIAAESDATKLREIWNLPATQVLEKQTVGKLARAPFDFLKGKTDSKKDFAPLFEPLIRDLERSESVFRMCERTNGFPEFSLAVALDSAQAAVWQSNLGTVLSTWTRMKTTPLQQGGVAGWQLKKHHAPDLFRFIRAGNWAVLSCGENDLPLEKETLAQIQRSGRPLPALTNEWLTAHADWPRLSKWIQMAGGGLAPLPNTTLQISCRDENVRTKVIVEDSKPFAWHYTPWQIPTNIIHEPLVSFTAVRGIEPWLSRQRAIQSFVWRPMPNQLFVWAMARVPFQTFIAMPVSNPTNIAKQLQVKLASKFNVALKKHNLGGIVWKTNENMMAWQGAPFISPFLQPLRAPSGDFLMAGLFPKSDRTNVISTDLMGQLNGHTNLFYYNWEITALRLPQLRQMCQLGLFFSGRRQLDGKSASAKWLDAIGPKLGNTVTELTRTSAREMTLIRKSPIGFDAAELVALANWLELTKFPCQFRVPTLAGPSPF